MAEPSPAGKLLHMLMQSALSRGIQVAAKLNVATLIGDEPKTAEELARLTGTHAPSLSRLLRFLAGNGVFQRLPDKRFALTPLAEPLRDGPRSLRPVALWQDQLSPAREQMLYSVQTGGSAFEKVFGKPIFEWHREHAEVAEIFNNAMSAHAANNHRSLVEAYDFGRFKVVTDIGGGHGALMTAILNANPKLKGVIFDLPQAIEGTKKKLAERGLADRCEAIGGDFFEAVPAGGDCYLMSHIIHDWDDTKSIAIYKNIRKVMKPDGVLLTAEMILPDGNEFSLGGYMDMLMLVISPGGLERTEAEYRALYEASGFKPTRLISTDTALKAIEGTPA